METYRVTGMSINTITIGQLIKINQITYSGTFSCNFIVNGRMKAFHSNLHHFELIE